jgi:hypothetical protein
MSIDEIFNAILNPKTGTIVVLSVAVVIVWRSLKESEKLRERLHELRIQDAKAVIEAVNEQRTYHAELREKFHEQQLTLQETINRATNVIERCEDSIRGSRREVS